MARKISVFAKCTWIILCVLYSVDNTLTDKNITDNNIKYENITHRNIREKNITGKAHYVIDWSSDAEHLPGRFGLKKVSESQLHKWKMYISIVIRLHISHRQPILSLCTVFHSLHKIEKWLKIHEYSFLNSLYTLHSPIHKIKLETRQTGFIEWVINVHSNFMINVTIHKGFVPFSISCKHKASQISMHECNKQFCELIEWLCGHVHMEYLYSKGNQATLKISSHIDNVPLAASIHASYHVLAKGMAYRFNRKYIEDCRLKTHYRCHSHEWDFDIPERIIVYQQSINLIWYVETSTRFFIQEFQVYNNEPMIVVRNLKCLSTAHGIFVYLGLLSMYMMEGRTEPMITRLCNMMYSSDLELIGLFHKYATIRLFLPIWKKSSLYLRIRSSNSRKRFFLSNIQNSYVSVTRVRLNYQSYTCFAISLLQPQPYNHKKTAKGAHRFHKEDQTTGNIFLELLIVMYFVKCYTFL